MLRKGACLVQCFLGHHPPRTAAISYGLIISSTLTRSAADLSHTTPNSLATDVDFQFSGTENVFDTPAPSKFIYYLLPYPILTFTSSCLCDEPSLCHCSSTSVSLPSTASMTHMTSSNPLRDMLLRHHVTHSRTSVFHLDMPTIPRSLHFHAIPHARLSSVQCRRRLLHIMMGACADHAVDTSLSLPPVVPPAVLCQDFEPAADLPKAVLNIILDVDPT